MIDLKNEDAVLGYDRVLQTFKGHEALGLLKAIVCHIRERSQEAAIHATGYDTVAEARGNMVGAEWVLGLMDEIETRAQEIRDRRALEAAQRDNPAPPDENPFVPFPLGGGGLVE